MTGSQTLVRTSATGLVTIERQTRTMRNRLALVYKIFMDMKPCRPLYITLANFQETPVHIPKRINVLIAAEAPTAMWDPNARRKSSCIEQTTDPFKESVFTPKKPPSRDQNDPGAR